jgi:hypothetical protein
VRKIHKHRGTLLDKIGWKKIIYEKIDSLIDIITFQNAIFRCALKGKLAKIPKKKT